MDRFGEQRLRAPAARRRLDYQYWFL